ncbi:hypothetical protein [Paenibacillus puerhi]|uniref:hypothetical protein n=1 Tax=Paenibacillus puerhi TaxID=2692622 RepID=UPI00135A536F|nr:hypothetical protein [Paenibacillus puerhi]
MVREAMKRRTLILAMACLSLVYYILCIHEKAAVERTIHGFYDGFIRKDFTESYTYFDMKFRSDISEDLKMSLIAQQLINDRHWYGDIQGFHIWPMLWGGRGTKVVYVKVTYLHSLEKGDKTDKLTIQKIHGEWVITQYASGSPWPNLP